MPRAPSVERKRKTTSCTHADYILGERVFMHKNQYHFCMIVSTLFGTSHDDVIPPPQYSSLDRPSARSCIRFRT